MGDQSKLEKLEEKIKLLEVEEKNLKNKTFYFTILVSLLVPIVSILGSYFATTQTLKNNLRISQETIRKDFELTNLRFSQTSIQKILEEDNIIDARKKIQFYMTSGMIDPNNDSLINAIGLLIEESKSLTHFAMGYDLNDQAYKIKSEKERKATYWKAIAEFSQAMEYDPTNPYVFQSRGLAYKNLGDFYGKYFYQKAYDDYTIAISLDSLNEYNYYLRGTVSNYLGKYKSTVKDLKRVQSKKGDWIFQYNFAEALLVTNEKSAACNHFSRFRQLKPGYSFTDSEQEKFAECLEKNQDN